MFYSRKCSVDLGDDLFQLLILFAVQGDALLPRHHVHGFLVRVVLADVDIGLAAELTNLQKVKNAALKSNELLACKIVSSFDPKS